MLPPFHRQRARAQAILTEPPFHVWHVPPSGTHWCEFRRLSNEGGDIHLRFPDLADFVIAANGERVDASPVPDLDDVTLEHLQLNQVLPLVLSAQGRAVFHASAVVVAGDAVAFLGESGRGKSTLATHLALKGAPLLTDDGLCLWLPGESGSPDHTCWVEPSHPSVRLWQDSEDALIGGRMAAAPAVSYTRKARFLADQLLPLCSEARPMRRAYFLGDGSAEGVRITPMTAREAAIEWVKHSFLLDIGDKSRLATHFEQVGLIAALNLSYRLDYPRDYGMLDAVQMAISEHAHAD